MDMLMAEGKMTFFPSCSTFHVIPSVFVTAVTFSVPSGDVTTVVFSFAAHNVWHANIMAIIVVMVFIYVIIGLRRQR